VGLRRPVGHRWAAHVPTDYCDPTPTIVLYTADAGDGKAAGILADNLEADPNSIELSATTILPPLNSAFLNGSCYIETVL
jgi:hypothetical protein